MHSSGNKTKKQRASSTQKETDETLGGARKGSLICWLRKGEKNNKRQNRLEPSTAESGKEKAENQVEGWRTNDHQVIHLSRFLCKFHNQPGLFDPILVRWLIYIYDRPSHPLLCEQNTDRSGGFDRPRRGRRKKRLIIIFDEQHSWEDLFLGRWFYNRMDIEGNRCGSFGWELNNIIRHSSGLLVCAWGKKSVLLMVSVSGYSWCYRGWNGQFISE